MQRVFRLVQTGKSVCHWIKKKGSNQISFFCFLSSVEFELIVCCRLQIYVSALFSAACNVCASVSRCFLLYILFVCMSASPNCQLAYSPVDSCAFALTFFFQIRTWTLAGRQVVVVKAAVSPGHLLSLPQQLHIRCKPTCWKECEHRVTIILVEHRENGRSARLMLHFKFLPCFRLHTKIEDEAEVQNCAPTEKSESQF